MIPKGTPEVSRAAIADFPSEAALADLDEGTEIEPVPNVALQIRATDRDKRHQGWAGKVEGFRKRMPITLYPTVDPESLAEHSQVRVNAMVEFKVTGEKREPIRVHVLEVLDPAITQEGIEVLRGPAHEKPQQARIGVIRDD